MSLTRMFLARYIPASRGGRLSCQKQAISRLSPMPQVAPRLPAHLLALLPPRSRPPAHRRRRQSRLARRRPSSSTWRSLLCSADVGGRRAVSGRGERVHVTPPRARTQHGGLRRGNEVEIGQAAPAEGQSDPLGCRGSVEPSLTWRSEVLFGR